MAKAGVLGAGSWGTALALLLDKNGHDVTVWSIDQAEVEMLDREREHKSKLPGVKLPQTMKFTNEIQEAITDQDFMVLAVPSPFTRATAKKMAPFVKKDRKSSMWQRESRKAH